MWSEVSDISHHIKDENLPKKCWCVSLQAVSAEFKTESAVALTRAVARHLQEANERKDKDQNWYEKSFAQTLERISRGEVG